MRIRTRSSFMYLRIFIIWMKKFENIEHQRHIAKLMKIIDNLIKNLNSSKIYINNLDIQLLTLITYLLYPSWELKKRIFVTLFSFSTSKAHRILKISPRWISKTLNIHLWYFPRVRIKILLIRHIFSARKSWYTFLTFLKINSLS